MTSACTKPILKWWISCWSYRLISSTMCQTPPDERTNGQTCCTTCCRIVGVSSVGGETSCRCCTTFCLHGSWL